MADEADSEKQTPTKPAPAKPPTDGKPRIPPWKHPFFMIVTTITVMVLAYYVFYVSNQRNYYAERSIRLLGELARRIEQQTTVRSISAQFDPQEPTTPADSPNAPKSPPGEVTVGIANGTPFIDGPKGRQTFPIVDELNWSLLQERFDDVWIRDGQGKVLAQLNPSGRRAEAPPQTNAPNAGSNGAQPANAPGTLDKLGDALSAFWNFAWPSDAKQVSFWGQPYLAFSYPLQLPTKATGGGKTVTVNAEKLDGLHLYGIVAQDRFRSCAITLSYLSLMGASGIVLLAFLAVPYVKVRFMAERERMRSVDLWLLGASGFVAAQLSMLAIFALCWHAVISGRLDHALERFADEMTANASAETKSAAAELGAYVSKLSSEAWPWRGDAVATGDAGATYPYLENVFFTDQLGHQLSKLQAGSVPTAPVTLAEESYFKAAVHASPPPDAAPVLRTTHAPNSGRYLAVVAQPTASPPGVAALATRLLSLMEPVVPYPLRYAVLDRRGDVVFGRGQHESPQTNFLDEIDGYSRIGAASVGSARIWLNARYLGRMHRMLLSPLVLPGAEPLTLVTFYDRAVVDSLMFEAVTATSFWMLIGLLIAGGAMLVARALFGPWFADWLWPCEGRSTFYVAGTGALLAIALIMILATSCSAMQGVASLVLLLPGIVLFTISAARPVRDPCRSRDIAPRSGRSLRVSDWYPFTYLAFIVMLLAVIASLPTVLIVNETFQSYAQALGHMTQRSQAIGLESRYQEIKRRYVATESGQATFAQDDRVKIAAAHLDEVRSKRWNASWDVYTPPFASAAWENTPSCASDVGKKPCVDRRQAAVAGSTGVPTIARCGFELHASGASTALTRLTQIAAACLPTSTSMGLNLRAQLFDSGEKDSEVVATDAGPMRWLLPTFTTPGLLEPNPVGRTLGLFALFMITATICWYVTRSVATDILGLELEGDGIIDRVDAFTASIPASQDRERARWLLLRPPFPPKSKLPEDLRPVDLTGSKYDDPNAAVQLGSTSVIWNLHARLTSEKWREELVKRIAASPDKDLVVQSAIDPVYWLTKHPSAGPNEVLQWSAAMMSVRKARFKVPADVDADLLTSLAPTPGNHREERAADVVIQECRWSDELVKIGKRFNAQVLAPLSEAQIVEHVLDEAEPYYRFLWSLCSVDEKIVLIQLAEEGLVNPRHFDVLRRLRRRHLVRTRGQICVMNESFTRFVCQAESAKDVADWECNPDGKSSAQVQLPLITIATATAGLLLFTQQQLFDSLTGVTTAAIGAAGAIGGLLTRLRNPMAPQQPQ